MDIFVITDLADDICFTFIAIKSIVVQ